MSVVVLVFVVVALLDTRWDMIMMKQSTNQTSTHIHAHTNSMKNIPIICFDNSCECMLLFVCGLEKQTQVWKKHKVEHRKNKHPKNYIDKFKQDQKTQLLHAWQNKTSSEFLLPSNWIHVLVVSVSSCLIFVGCKYLVCNTDDIYDILSVIVLC